MRIMYFGENKEEGAKRVAVIRFTDDEFDLYKYIENYEHTYGDETRKFACGGLIGIERNEKGVWINESYISVDNFTDFNDFKANYKEAKKEFKSLKKQTSETTEPETETETTEPETETETTEPETTDIETAETEETTDPEILKPLEIKPKIYFIGSLREENVERFHVDVMSDNKRIGSCELYIEFNENGFFKKAMCRFLYIFDDFKGCEVEIRFLRMLANEYNGIFCIPYDSDDCELYYQIGEECKIPCVFEWSHVVEKCFFISPVKKTNQSKRGPTHTG